ncbi:hypothetical protein GQ55_3G459300 [Panicum hallii var. hallii]|uniref:Uncharacterized protein n=1 Tax=Panicum hallii var. hallii TaxID=1504633 RepID=A0A2T7EIU3_9POAL|nr:hypothetical protein GQ55_3G459300 [Panicum hallii var. hallii]
MFLPISDDRQVFMEMPICHAEVLNTGTGLRRLATPFSSAQSKGKHARHDQRAERDGDWHARFL